MRSSYSACRSLSRQALGADRCESCRRVSGLVSFQDPDGLDLELVYGFNAEKEPFVSPTGARFVTGVGWMGHVFQLVEDEDAYSRLYFDLLGFKLSDHIDFGPLQGIFTHCNERHHSFAFAMIPNAPKGISRLMFEVDDIDVVGRAYDKVLAGAASLELTFGRHSNDKMQSFYVRTPSGFSVEYGYGGTCSSHCCEQAGRRAEVGPQSHAAPRRLPPEGLGGGPEIAVADQPFRAAITHR